MKKNWHRKYLQYAILVVLLLGAIQPNYGIDIGELPREIGTEKSVLGTELFKAWEKVNHLPYAFRIDVDNLKYIDDILSSNLGRIEKTNLIESKIVNSNYEHGAILDSDGSLMVFRVGEENSIDFSDLYGSIPEGKYFTHNHPSNGIFSDADISTNSFFKFAEFNAVTQSGKKYKIIRTTESVDDVTLPQIAVVRQDISFQLQAQYSAQLNDLVQGSPEYIALQRVILEEWDRLTLNHFGYNHLVE